MLPCPAYERDVDVAGPFDGDVEVRPLRCRRRTAASTRSQTPLSVGVEVYRSAVLVETPGTRRLPCSSTSTLASSAQTANRRIEQGPAATRKPDFSAEKRDCGRRVFRRTGLLRQPKHFHLVHVARKRRSHSRSTARKASRADSRTCPRSSTGFMSGAEASRSTLRSW